MHEKLALGVADRLFTQDREREWRRGKRWKRTFSHTRDNLEPGKACFLARTVQKNGENRVQYIVKSKIHLSKIVRE